MSFQHCNYYSTFCCIPRTLLVLVLTFTTNASELIERAKPVVLVFNCCEVSIRISTFHLPLSIFHFTPLHSSELKYNNHTIKYSSLKLSLSQVVFLFKWLHIGFSFFLLLLLLGDIMVFDKSIFSVRLTCILFARRQVRNMPWLTAKVCLIQMWIV